MVWVPAKTWTKVFTYWNPLPTQSVTLRTEDHSRFAYKVYGAGPPFYIKITGNPGIAEPRVGWCGAYCEIKVRTKTGANFSVISNLS